MAVTVPEVFSRAKKPSRMGSTMVKANRAPRQNSSSPTVMIRLKPICSARFSPGWRKRQM